MAKDKPKRRRNHHLRVPVLPEEREIIERQAEQAGMTVACYLREVGQGYKISGITDYEKVRELANINGDLGRLGGLLKLWLTNDERTLEYGEDLIRAVLSKIENTQDEMGLVMSQIVRPRADHSKF